MDPAHDDHRTRFLQLALRADALRFGQFTLKSGRSSPYFFNAGRFDSGAALACEYARRGRDLPLAFNRKEAKAHGEGGSLIGAALAGKRVLIVDDVITAGTAIREALDIIAAAGGIAAGIVIALDRQERVREEVAQSAAQAVATEHGIPVIAVAGLSDLLEFAGESADLVRQRDALLAYRARYGIA